MFTLIKGWLSGKIMIVAIVIGSVLLASLGTMTILYSKKSTAYDLQVTNNGTLVANNASLKIKIDGLNQQLEEERKRHETLESTKQQIFDDYIRRQNDLDEKKNNQEKKAAATKNPSAYEKEVQKALDDYQNRMNCITGNASACSRL